MTPQLACGLMAAFGAIMPPEERLVSLLHDSPDLPEGADPQSSVIILKALFVGRSPDMPGQLP